MIFSDLLDEQICDSADDGVLGRVERTGSFGAKIFRAEIVNDEQAKFYNKAKGRYSTLNINPIIHTYHKARHYAGRLLASELMLFLPQNLQLNFTILVVGLGNAFVLADSLGANVIKNLLPTHNMPTKMRQDLGDLACFIPGVSGMNGIPTFDMVHSVVANLRPKLLIIIDALTARNYERLGCSFQISNNSITPGAGVGNKNRVLDKEGLGVDIVTIGVPMMINARNFADLEDLPNIVLTPKEIDFYTQTCSQIVASAINLSVHGKNYLKYL